MFVIDDLDASLVKYVVQSILREVQIIFSALRHCIVTCIAKSGNNCRIISPLFVFYGTRGDFFPFIHADKAPIVRVCAYRDVHDVIESN